MSMDAQDFMPSDSELLSHCCGAVPMGEVIDGWAVCSRCKEHAPFTPEEEQVPPSPGEKLAKFLEPQAAVELGFGGVLSGGQIVDRRKHPKAIPLQKNPHLGIPAPKAVSESEVEL